MSFTNGQINFPDNDDYPFDDDDPFDKEAKCLIDHTIRGTCRPLPECLSVYTQLADLQQRPCLLGNKLFGVCCPDSNEQTPTGVGSFGTLTFNPPPNIPVPKLRFSDFQRAAEAAVVVVEKRFNLEQQLFVQRIIVKPGTSVKLHLDLFKTTAKTLSIGNAAIKNLETSIQLVNQ